MGRWLFGTRLSTPATSISTGWASISVWTGSGRRRLRGIGEKPGMGLTGEREGFVPSRQWKKAAFREGWYPGDTVNLWIGQGYIRRTPLQMARMGCVLASRGKLFKPRLVLKITNPSGKPSRSFPR